MRLGRSLSIFLVTLLILGLLVPYVPVGVWMQPPTGSMRPTSVGCSVTVYGPPTPAEGDVVWYWEDDSTIITHRIVDIREDTVIFKGDNRATTDSPVNHSQLHAESYYNFDLGVKRSDCVSVVRPLYNAYFMSTGSERRFEDSRVD